VTAEERLAIAFLEARPARAALALEQMPRAQAVAVLRAAPARPAAGVVREMTPPHAAALVGELAVEAAAAVLAELPVDHAAAVLRALGDSSRDQLVAALTAVSREPFARLLQYPVGTAGASMDPSVFQVTDEVLVVDARSRLREAARDLLYYVYIVDRQQRLVGVLDIPELMLARPRDPVSATMHRDPERLPAWMPVAQVREHPGWHSYHAMPVVDDEQRLLGAIRYQTLRQLERDAKVQGPDPATLTARALGELFQVGTNGLVAGVAATASVARRPAAEGQATDDEVRDAE
jgi:magnesium transporter